MYFETVYSVHLDSFIHNTNECVSDTNTCSYIVPTCFGVIYTIFMELYTEILNLLKYNTSQKQFVNLYILVGCLCV